MKTKKLKHLGFLLIIMLLSVNFSFAQENTPPPPPNGPMCMNFIPNLTDDQNNKIDALQLDLQKTTNPLKAELEIKHAEMKVLNASDASMDKKEAKLKEINELHFKLDLAKTEYHHNVRNLLSEEQKVAFDNWTINHDNHRGNKHNKGNKNMNGKGQRNGPVNGQYQGQGYGRGNRQCPNK
ncbi:MAG: hypothetical protein JXL97_19070 [Bacteroidales bacterium]|nr:hypothetical protein [Bacteroidales bacterium]